MEDNSKKTYYTKVDKSELDNAKVKVKHIIQEGLYHNIITLSEYQAMDPERGWLL